MEMPMKGFGYSSSVKETQPVEGGPEAIMHSTNSGIRSFTVAHAPALEPQDDCKGRWVSANPQTVPDFSATAYFFARLVNQVLNIPVGLIHVSWGGSRIEAWMPSASLKDIPEKTIPDPQSELKSSDNYSPTVLYNGMLHPVVGYGIRGAIWYQGESNKNEYDLYVRMFDRMVREWRNIWGVGEFPFYYCQIAPFNSNGVNSAFMREAQAKGMITTPNTGMAVLMDANSVYNIHPAKKKDAGERLALWALSKTYGMNNFYRSPEVKSVEKEGRMIIVTFEMFGSNNGLTTYGKEIKNFTIAASDKRFMKAKAAVAGNKVYVFAPEMANPEAVRYCFDDTSETEIFTSDSRLPVSSFRTDNW
jgi:sialate O-acetylesterase